MKFIHTADLHLDSPFLGLKNNGLPDELWEKVHQSTFDSFKRIIDGAIEQQVDFVLLVGDLFDREERSVAADAFLINQLNRLKDHEIEAFVSFGNHDYSTATRLRSAIRPILRYLAIRLRQSGIRCMTARLLPLMDLALTSSGLRNR